jgi:hypothetical protein
VFKVVVAAAVIDTIASDHGGSSLLPEGGFIS